MSVAVSALVSSAIPLDTPGGTATPVPSAISTNLSPWLLEVIVVGGLILAGVFVLINLGQKAARRKERSSIPLPSSIRAWMAIALIVALVVYTGATLSGPDESVRSALVGGLVAAVSSATAYYFAAAQAQGAINAAVAAEPTPTPPATPSPTAGVPPLTGMPLNDALATIGATNFRLVVNAASVPAAAMPPVVAEQTPAAGQTVARTAEIVVRLVPAALEAAEQ